MRVFFPSRDKALVFLIKSPYMKFLEVHNHSEKHFSVVFISSFKHWS